MTLATTVREPVSPPAEPSSPVPEGDLELRPGWQQPLVYAFVVGPFVALVAGIVLAAFGHGITWLDVALFVVFYAISGHGVTVGYHRLLTHGSFKANAPLRYALAAAGSLAVEGSVIRWVADHRRHHAFADRAGDPHSPWRFGESPRALLKGFWWAHTGWLFDREKSSQERYTPDLLADPGLVRIHALFPLWIVVSIFAPALVALAVTGSWAAAAGALLWAGLVRIFLLHHVTWSINSICHMWGERPFRSRDRSTNVWPLAVLSMGESWHNLHHADPTCARHGAQRGQLDSTARLIWVFERLGWARDVRWPRPERLAARRADA